MSEDVYIKSSESPRDCRLCANFTTQTGGCISTVQCVDSAQYKATAPRQYWIAGPCIGNDPTCPCQDGALCHYRDSPDGKTQGWPVPAQGHPGSAYE